MFGMGLGEIFLIAVVAILFLGPEKLPSAMVEIAKFFKSVKSTVHSAKATLEDEMKFSEMKQEVLNYKNELTGASAELERMANITEIGSEINAVKNDLDLSTVASSAPAAPKEPEVITFAPKAKEQPPHESKTSEENR